MLRTVLLVCVLFAATTDADPTVNSIWPTVGSTAGGTRVTIHGSDFSEDGFNFGADNEDKGNTVTFVADDQESHVCITHKDGHTETMITCDMQGGLTHNKVYFAKVKVDGVDIPAAKTCSSNRDQCGFKAHNWWTPTITELSHSSYSIANDDSRLVTVKGRIVTDLSGSDKTVATNGVTVKFKRVYIGDNKCELRNANNDMYGMALDAEDSYNGYFTCKMTGTFTGYSKFAFLLDNPYGRSKVYEEHVSWNDKVYNIQGYTEVKSVSPNEGSNEGSTLVTVDGYYFEDGALNAPSGYSNMTFLIAGVPCTVVSVIRDSYATVLTPPFASLPTLTGTKPWPGNRGLYVEYWSSGTFATNEDLRDTTTDATGQMFLDETYFYNNTLLSRAYTRMTFFFRAPHDGSYRFYLQATNGGELYINGTSWATSTGNWASKGRITFTKGTYSKVIVVAMSGTNSEALVQAKFRFYNTQLLNSKTSAVSQEVWQVQLRSPIQNEEYSIVASGFTSQTKTNEVQKVCPTGGLKAKLCLHGVCTLNSITFSETTSVIETEMNKLPVLATGENIIAAVNSIDTTCYDITINSSRGNFPPITTNTAGVTVTTTETTAGIPDNKVFSLMYGAVPSRLETYDETDKTVFATKLDGMLEDIFSTGCPAIFTVGEGFDGMPNDANAVTSEIPFCGRHSYKNPASVFPLPGSSSTKTPNLNLKPWMCLAIKGLDNSRVYISYKTPSGTDRNNRGFDFTSVSVPESEGGWKYTCINLLQHVKSENSAESGDNYKLVRVFFRNDVDYFVDEVVLGLSAVLTINSDTDLTGVRRLPASPNPSSQVLVSDVAVIYNESEERYDVNLTMHDCGSNLNLLTLANSDVTLGSKTYPSDSVNSTLTGGSATLEVTSRAKATPALAGTYKLTVAGETTDALGAQDPDATTKNTMETSTNVGSVKVTTSSSSTCATKDINIELSSKAGDQDLGSLTSVSLSAPTGATGVLVDKTDGHLEVAPIMGDYLRTAHDTPQIEVTVNNVPTKCENGKDCSFEYKSSATPTISTLSQSSGASSLELTITGTLLASDATVDIGGVACAVTSGTVSSIICTVGDGPIGEHNVLVRVPAYGQASGSLQFEYTSDLSGISPIEGSLGGGNTMTVSGHGFSSASQVLVNDVECVKLGVPTASSITCAVPAFATTTSTTQDEAVTVKVQKGATVMTTTATYTYKRSLTAAITTLTLANPLSVSGGASISIVGTNFGSSPSLSIGGTACVISSSSETNIEATTPVLAPGDAQVVAVNNDHGNALLDDALPTRDVGLVVNNMYPVKGSYLGGTRITLTGTGYGTDKDAIEVTVGNTPCVVDSATNQQVVCDIQSTANWHYVSNLGTTGMGIYYAFNVTKLPIPLGDCIKFTWTSPGFTDITHGIYQTDNVSTAAKTPDGIDSGTPSSNGNYEYCFTSEGTYVLSSGHVDAAALRIYHMTVTVTSRSSSSGPLSLKVQGQEAAYTVGGAGDPTNSGCAMLTADIDDCTPGSVTHENAALFNFEFANCRTPVVNAFTFESVNPALRSVKGSTVLTVTGKGFSDSNACTNKAMIGDCSCTVTTVSSTKFTCVIDSSCSYPIAEYLKLSLNVGGLGTAQMNIASWKSQSVAYLMEVTGFSPSSVSTEGGTLVTVTGSALSSATLVQIDDGTVDFTENSGTLVVTTRSSVKAAANLTVYAGSFKAECSTSNNKCELSFTSSQTPTISAVSPSEVSSQTDLTFTGTKFGTDQSAVSVSIAGEDCAIQSLGDTSVTCRVTALPVGVHSPVLNVRGLGNAKTTQTVTAEAALTAVNPITGSVNGGTNLVFTGHGFNGDTTVAVDGVSICKDIAVTLQQVTCTTLPHVEESLDITVTSNGITFPTVSYSFSDAKTPSITSVTASIASGGTMTIEGSGFGTSTSAVSVYMENYECTVTSVTDVEIQCTVGVQRSGAYSVAVLVSGEGFSNNGSTTYQIGATGINPTSGAKVGNQLLTIMGTGFTDQVTATVCDEPCIRDSFTTSSLVCITPSGAVGDCAVKVQDGASATPITAGTYTYNEAATPVITSINPNNGGTGGGTRITLGGTGLSGTSIGVSINGVGCVVDTGSSTVTEIVCTTGQHTGTISAPVLTTIDGVRAVGAWSYQYVDRWSSTATWGNLGLPQAGEIISIPAGQHVLLDMDTPILALLLIEGTLSFDSNVASINLNSKIILINGGEMLAGTAESPYPSKIDIVLHGSVKDYSLPIYGAKNIAVRKGKLGLYGMPTTTWTKLTSTANAGSSVLNINTPGEGWVEGDTLAIATTGDKHSQGETELRTISAVSADKKTITLSEALTYTHTSKTDFSCSLNGGGTLERDMSGEVGKLDRNIRVRGDSNSQWVVAIEACPEGFDTGEFATQTCFQGRFGEDMGSDEFGVQIIVHPAIKDLNEAIAQLSYVEITHAGQAFQLGRYPVHFHLGGDMSQSYVNGCAIHTTYNRAVNIHGTHNVNVEHNVAYNVMGGAFFLEDGIETRNVYKYNLAMFIKASTSLLNDDITPAAFWATNPDNDFLHNAVAGGSHFGFWYRMLEDAAGPSSWSNICPRHVPLGRFFNNSVHSVGWFGLWTFEDYYPVKGGGCHETTPELAIFDSLTTWNCDKGAEFVNYANVQLNMFVSAHDKLTGFEAKQDVGTGCLSPTLKDSCIVGKMNTDDTPTAVGVKVPYGTCFQMENTTLAKLPLAYEFTEIQGTCTVWCGGWPSYYRDMRFEDVDKLVNWRWVHEGTMIDVDGSLCGVSDQGCRLIPYSGTHIPNTLLCDNSCTRTIQGLPAQFVKSSVDFLRFGFKGVSPSSLDAKNVTMTNENGFTVGYYNDKRLTEKPGWMVNVLEGHTYKMEFENAPEMVNISFTGTLYGLKEGHCIIFGLPVASTPDNLFVSGSASRVVSETAFDCTTSSITTGDWFVSSGFAYVALKGPAASTRRKRSGSGIPKGDNDLAIDFKLEKCFYEKCITPHNPDTDPPITARPEDYHLWTNASIWNLVDGEYVTVTDASVGSAGLPIADSNVVISSNTAGAWWILIKQYSPPNLGNAVLYGTVEIDFETDYAYTFSAKNIIIFGGRLVVGWPNNPMLGTADIVLLGDTDSPWYTEVDGYTVSNKAIGAFGGLDLHGAATGSSWARLASTAAKGTNTLALESGADLSGWRANDEIVLTTTSRNSADTEYLTIASVDASARTVTVTQSLANTHHALIERVGNTDYVFAAAVGHLSKRVRVRGEDVSLWGGRIMAAVGQKGDDVKTGFVRASNAEFKYMGQEGYTDADDPRFAISLKGSSGNDIRPNNIKDCSFHHLYNSAIGLFDSDNITIENNVVAGPVGNGMVFKSDSLSVLGNLVTNQAWIGSYNGRAEVENIRWEANINAITATNFEFRNNFAAGAERVGFRVPGEDCAMQTTKYENNFAVGNLMGVNTFHEDDLTVAAGQTCTRWSGFRTWNNHDYGIYYNNFNEFEGNDLVTAGENSGLFVFVVGPGPLTHSCSNKKVTITNSIFIGTPSNHDCSGYTTASGTYISTSSHCRWQRSGLGARLGVIPPVYSGGPNNSPLKPCGNIMAYNAICGKTHMTRNTFMNFGPHSTCGASFANAFSPLNDDANHAVYIGDTTLVNVNEEHKVLIPRPQVGKINSADCVDMDCDALKKALLVDVDGTFSGGTPTSYISESEYQWDGSDTRRGYGDYRIPKSMLTDANGDRIELNSEIRDGNGIFRSGCTKIIVDNTGLWKCPNSKYELLVIESMDADTETRRLSPIGINNGRYYDLLNGPQDHGWCSGYTCRLRMSTFITIVAPGQPLQIYLSSTEPEKTKFFMIRADESSCVVVAFFFTNPNRIDIKISDAKLYKLPTNGLMVNGQFSYKQDGTKASYIPTCSDDHGSNYIDKDERLVYFVLKGSGIVHLERAKVLVLAMSVPMTADEFFASNLLENLALLLNIRLDKIRVVNVVAETGSRRRRSTSGTTIELEIGDGPNGDAEEDNNNQPEPNPDNSEAAETSVENEVTTMAETLAQACQDGSLGTSLDTQELGCENITVSQTTYTLAVPSELRFEDTIVSQHENVPFSTQPSIRAYDTNGNAVPDLGVENALWEVTATLRSGTGHASAVLSGNTTITAVSGWLNYTDLTISHAGSGYIIDFEITAPASAAAMNLSVSSAEITVAGLPMVAGLNSVTSGDIIQDSTFSLTFDLRDNTTNERITDITWRGHTFSVNCALVFSPETGSLTGTLSKTFDTSTGTALYNDLAFSGSGLVILGCQIESVPAEYSFTHYQEVWVYTAAQASVATEDTSVVKLRFAEDYYTTLPSEAAEKQFLMAVIQRLTTDDTRVKNAYLEQGSILVIYTVEGSVVSVSQMNSDLCSNVTAGITVTVGSVTLTMDTYMQVDGVDYYATCSSTASDDDDDGLHGAFIALIAVICLIVLVLVVLLLLWKFKVLPKTKTHGGMRIAVQGFHGETTGEATGNRYAGGFYYIDNGRTVFLAGPNQRVEDIFYKQKNGGVVRQSSDMAPPVTTLYDDLEMNNATTRKSPLPHDSLYKEPTMTRPDN